MDEYLTERLDQLKHITRNCRDDMHEPDEQEVYASVVGTHLDNAFGEDTQLLPAEHQEFVVIIKSKIKDVDEVFKINLATLIALARKAK